MQTETLNTNILNNINPISFMTCLKSEVTKLNTLIIKQEKLNKILSNFSNNLNMIIDSCDDTQKKEEFLNIQTKSQNYINKVNEKKQEILNLQNDLNLININLEKLLQCIDENSQNSTLILVESKNIETKFEEYYTKLNDLNKQIYKSDLIINNFLKNTVSNIYQAESSFDKANNTADSNSYNVSNNIENNDLPKNDNIENNINSNQISSNINENVEVQKTSDNNYKDNLLLKISENLGKVYLPYTASEILSYIEKYPNKYSNFDEVVEKEFIVPLSYYMKHPAISRFKETYFLIHNKENKNALQAFKVAMEFMVKSDLNPAIIAACKTKKQLDDYMNCLKNNKLNEFKDFEIKFEISPL